MRAATQVLTDTLGAVHAGIRQSHALLGDIAISREIMLPRLILDTIPRRPEGLGKVLVLVVGRRLADQPVQQQPRAIDIGIAVS